MMKAAHILALALAGLLCSSVGADAGALKRPVLVELFTSQGCNSCPPADALLGRLAKRPDVIAMSLPVTYWDMLGWKDTLASENNTQRQKAYAQFMGRGGVYTPQVIVDGVSDVVGSREADVLGAIAKREAEIQLSEAHRDAMLAASHAAAARAAALAQASYSKAHGRPDAELASARRAADAAHDAIAASLAVPVSVSETPDGMHIRVARSDDKAGRTATIWLFHLRNAVSVDIASGENGGRTITYHNVVADLRKVGDWNGDSVSLNVPRGQLQGLPHDAVAVVVQQGGYGRVIGATLLSHPDFQASH